MGIIGRRAFHIFDKTHRTWITSTKKLGYQKLAKISQDDDSDKEKKETGDDVVVAEV